MEKLSCSCVWRFVIGYPLPLEHVLCCIAILSWVRAAVCLSEVISSLDYPSVVFVLVIAAGLSASLINFSARHAALNLALNQPLAINTSVGLAHPAPSHPPQKICKAEVTEARSVKIAV